MDKCFCYFWQTACLRLRSDGAPVSKVIRCTAVELSSDVMPVADGTQNASESCYVAVAVEDSEITKYSHRE